jgi:hypothetical protein
MFETYQRSSHFHFLVAMLHDLKTESSATLQNMIKFLMLLSNTQTLKFLEMFFQSGFAGRK